MKTWRKKDFPVSQIRRYLEPGPIVLVSSHWKGQDNIMTMGWHMVMAFGPSRIGCCIWNANHSHRMIRRSRDASSTSRPATSPARSDQGPRARQAEVPSNPPLPRPRHLHGIRPQPRLPQEIPAAEPLARGGPGLNSG